MSFADLFEDMLPEFVYVEPWLSPSPQGGALYSAAVLIPNCRVVMGAKMLRDDKGQLVLSIATLYAGTDLVKIGPKDRVTLPDGSQPPILGAPRIFPDEDGDAVQTVNFGKGG